MADEIADIWDNLSLKETETSVIDVEKEWADEGSLPGVEGMGFSNSQSQSMEPNRSRKSQPLTRDNELADTASIARVAVIGDGAAAIRKAKMVIDQGGENHGENQLMAVNQELNCQKNFAELGNHIAVISNNLARQSLAFENVGSEISSRPKEHPCGVLPVPKRMHDLLQFLEHPLQEELNDEPRLKGDSRMRRTWSQ
ncbi:putative elongation factor ts [Corchorus olitorius]|uniref:Elongation factor ts n=1 Tax=Corchorus olitorius TaxID=93759 RepID=A0A1R3KNW5_9ROSI|nr:putative elongation factor ts [Corchorus olitorius]